MDNRGLLRSTGLWLLVGSLMGIGVGFEEGIAPTPFGTTKNIVMQGIVANALTLVGVFGLARCSAGSRTLGVMSPSGAYLVLTFVIFSALLDWACAIPHLPTQNSVNRDR